MKNDVAFIDGGQGVREATGAQAGEEDETSGCSEMGTEAVYGIHTT